VHVEVFAVEDTSIQVCWRDAPPGEIVVRAGDSSTTVDGRGGAGGAVVDGLPPSSTVKVSVAAPRRRPLPAGSITTLTPPPGRRLCRFATVNDLHLGSRFFGTLRPIWNDDPADPAPVRCARAALAEAHAWGAETLVVKGDMTQRGRPSELQVAAELLGQWPGPVLAIEGNHETKGSSVDSTRIMADHGIDVHTTSTACLDLPGVRIIGVPTTLWHHGGGRLRTRIVHNTTELLASAPGGAVVALHHYPQRFRYPTFYPAGIPGDMARHALATWARANPAILVLAGHTHRHRRHEFGSLVLAEIGSTKDWPGTWAGYTVHEGGIMQTTRRVLEASAIEWTTRGRWVVGGLWGVWAPGLRSHRCFTYPWPLRSA